MSNDVLELNYGQPSLTRVEEFLGKIDLFRGLPPSTIRLVDKRIKKFSYKKGEQIMSEFEEAKGVYFVESGIVKLTKQDEHGNELIVCIKKEGEVFAEACLFNEEKLNYPASGTMIKEGEVYFLNTEDLEQELIMSPEMAVQMIRYMSSSLRDFTTIMRDIALLDVYAKTMKTLVRLADRFGAKRCNQMHIEIPMTVQEFSTLVGTSRESVSRVFSRLKKDGLIDTKDKQIIILDWCKFCAKNEEKV